MNRSVILLMLLSGAVILMSYLRLKGKLEAMQCSPKWEEEELRKIGKQHAVAYLGLMTYYLFLFILL